MTREEMYILNNSISTPESAVLPQLEQQLQPQQQNLHRSSPNRRHHHHHHHNNNNNNNNNKNLHHKKSEKKTATSFSTTSPDGLIETSLESESSSSSASSASSSGSNSDNSSTDEGIDNPEDVVLDDDYDDDDDDHDVDVDNATVKRSTVKRIVNNRKNSRDKDSDGATNCDQLDQFEYVRHVQSQPHSHHEHHHNHHYQHNHHHHHHHRRSRRGSSGGGDSKSTSHANPLLFSTSTINVDGKKNNNDHDEDEADFDEDEDDDEDQRVERFLNGTDAKHLADLRVEETNLLAEIGTLECEQSESEKDKSNSGGSGATKKSSSLTEVKLNSSSAAEDDDQIREAAEDDEELLEFQRIEREIKLSELRNCLRVIRKQIENIEIRQAITSVRKTQTELRLSPHHHRPLPPTPPPRPVSSVLQYANMTDSMLEECRLDAAQQVNLLDDGDTQQSTQREEQRAPLAVADEWDAESQITNISLPHMTTTTTTTTTIATVDSPTSQTTNTKMSPTTRKSLNGDLHLSDTSDDDDDGGGGGDDDDANLDHSKTTTTTKLISNGGQAPKKPIRKDSASSAAVTAASAVPESILIDRDEYYRQSLHEELLHESIEASLRQVNTVSDADLESFVISDFSPAPQIGPSQTLQPTTADKCSRTDSTAATNDEIRVQRNVGTIVRRESQYENVRNNNRTGCAITNRNGATLDDLLNDNCTINHHVTTSDTQSPNNNDNDIVIQRRSIKFPTTTSASNQGESMPPSGDDELVRRRNSSSRSSNDANSAGNQNHSRTSLASNSHRPLTLYLPSPNEELDLITHLHALGHDLTSAIVTNHLLLTPFTCSGYLYKQCAGSQTKWRKRYFHFNRVRKVFVYFHDRTAFEKRRHPKRGVFFDEIQDVYVDHTRINNAKKFFGIGGGGMTTSGSGNHHSSHTIIGSHLHSHRHQANNALSSSDHANSGHAATTNTRSVFVVSTTTTNRKFILSTYSPELMRIWMDVIFTGANAYLQDYEYDA